MKKILIVEDEMIIAESISDMLEELGYEVTGICMRANQALELIKNDQPDLALFDINLKGEEDGIWLGQQVIKAYNFPFIFLTSYGDKATIDSAIATSPYGYLLKPVEKQSLYSTIEVALRRAEEQEISDQGNDLIKVVKDYFFVKENQQNVKIQLNEIRYVKADDNYLEIHCEHKKHLLRSPLKTFLAQLPQKQFIQVHRSFFINLEQVSAYTQSLVKVGNTEIPVSKPYQKALSKSFQLIS